MAFDYSIIIPACNEASTLSKAISTLISFCERQSEQIEIILVENGSSDATCEIAKTLERDHASLRAVTCPEKGKGAAVLYGWNEARAPIVMFIDADLSPSLEILPRLYASVLTTGGCAIADRFLTASHVERSFFREIVSRVWARLASATLPLPHMDYQCGAKAIHVSLLDLLHRETEARDWFFDLDLLVVLFAYGIPVERLPVVWREHVFPERRSHVPLFSTVWRFLRGLRHLRKRSRPLRRSRVQGTDHL